MYWREREDEADERREEGDPFYTLDTLDTSSEVCTTNSERTVPVAKLRGYLVFQCRDHEDDEVSRLRPRSCEIIPDSGRSGGSDCCIEDHFEANFRRAIIDQDSDGYEEPQSCFFFQAQEGRPEHLSLILYLVILYFIERRRDTTATWG